ncbi:MAG: NAD(P)/FAD-dependent oxidoreductase [Candidatus Staskawiczbacteria bacterium]|nr:NAD(P)/FAD-dependent oxidoreductase [Candidatus Staskawiczbacteria bacterium]
MQKEDTKNKYDVAVIGAGPAGMMTAIQSARKGLRVVLLEKNKQLGKKLLLTGGGRCNFTNAEFNLKNLVANYHNGEFLFHAFSVFGPKETITFFEELGVKTKTEAGKRVFPASDDASELLEALKKELEKLGVKILYNSEVTDFNFKNNKITKIILKDGEVSAKKYVLATGGKSYKQTGSDGFGYKLAEKLGHTVVTPSPALCPIIIKEEWIKDLQGISLKNIKINGEAGDPPSRKASEGQEVMFTHFGISGPAVLNISANLPAKISLDLFPDLNQEEVLKSFEELLQKYPRQTIKNILCQIAPERFVEVFLVILEKSNPPSRNASAWRGKIGNNLSKIEKTLIIKNLKNFEMTVEDVQGWDNAMVTRGGVSLKEIDHKTMQSKILDNLFFAGEIIDADAKTGGFNLQLCWTTGHMAGYCI